MNTLLRAESQATPVDQPERNEQLDVCARLAEFEAICNALGEDAAGAEAQRTD